MSIDQDPELHTVPPDRGDMEDQPRWRRDFPIDLAQDGYVARRDFTKFLGLTSLAFVVGQFWIALQNRWRKTRSQLPTIEIANLNELRVGEAKTFCYPGETDPALLLRPDVDTVVAFSSECTHLQCPVLPDLAHNRLRCPCHSGYFDLTTGRPIAGPPRRTLPQITLEVRGGVVYATGFEEEA